MRLVVVLVALAAGAISAACGDDSNAGADNSAPPTTMTAEMDMNDTGASDHGHGDHGDSPATVAGARDITVTARSFRFEPAEIRIAAGEEVTIALGAADALHDFVIDELDFHLAAEEGETGRAGLRADRAGRYEFYCSVERHRDEGMEGVLIVE